VQAATTVHETLGPGFWQHVYTQCLAHELTLRGLETERNVPVAVDYKGTRCADAFQITLRVAGTLIVEVKAADRILPTHEAQLRNFLLRSGAQAALLINFHEPDITKAIRTIDWNAV
jgi:GxxExxY protein